MNASPITGLDLKLARVARRLKQRPVGEAMGVSYSRISAIEREAVVSAEIARRYFAALDTCDTSTSERVA